MKPPCSPRAGSAFSLTELLVSLVLVTVLSGLIFSVVNRARKAATNVECVQNFRRIYAGFLAYTQDHNGFIPPHHALNRSNIYAGYDLNQYWWMPAYLTQYVIKECPRWGTGRINQQEAEVFNCPARRRSLDEFWLLHSDPAVSYVMAAPPSDDQFRLINIQNRSRRLLITEGRHSIFYSGNAYTLDDDSQRDPSRCLRRFHNNGMNLLFYDGHVERFSGRDQELQAYLP